MELSCVEISWIKQTPLDSTEQYELVKAGFEIKGLRYTSRSRARVIETTLNHMYT